VYTAKPKADPLSPASSWLC